MFAVNPTTMPPNHLWQYLLKNQEEHKYEIGNALLVDLLNNHRTLLINEDVSFLESAFQSQRDLLNVLPIGQESFLRVVCVIFMAISFNLFFYYLSPFLFVSFIVILFTCLVSFLIFMNYRISEFFKSFAFLISLFEKEKKLYKKLFQLVEDGAVMFENDILNVKMISLQVCFKETCSKCSLDLRAFCLQLRENFKLKEEVDNDLICLLPEEFYQSFQENLNIKQLKSLKQLIRLQISELLKRFLLLFVKIYYSSPNDFNEDVLNTLRSNVLNPLIKQSTERQNNIQSTLFCYKSFYDQSSPKNATAISNNVSSFNWSICRNIRKSVYTSLNIIDQCESSLNSLENQLNSYDNSFISKLDLLQNEMSYIEENIVSLKKSISCNRICNSKSIVDGNTDNDNKEEEQQKEYPRNEPEYVIKDEVFEAINDLENCNYIDRSNDFENEKIPNNEHTSKNILLELRHALKDKAIEHKAREAKALGQEVNLDTLEAEYENTFNLVVNKKRDEATETVDEATLPNYDYNMRLSLNFDLAMNITQQGKLFLDLKEDTFGDSENSESESNNLSD